MYYGPTDFRFEVNFVAIAKGLSHTEENVFNRSKCSAVGEGISSFSWPLHMRKIMGYVVELSR